MTLCHCKFVKADSNQGRPQKPNSALSDHSQRPEGYHKVLDGRKRPIRGLWKRNDRFYARLAVTDREAGQTEVRRVPLSQAASVAQAQAELRRLQTQREDGDLPVLRQAPKFSDYMQTYLAYFEPVNPQGLMEVDEGLMKNLRRAPLWPDELETNAAYVTGSVDEELRLRNHPCLVPGIDRAQVRRFEEASSGGASDDRSEDRGFGAVDFFTAEVWTSGGLMTYYVDC